MKLTAQIVVRAILGVSMLFVGAAVADNFTISRSTIDGGGTVRSFGGNFELSGTIGQPDAGVMNGGAFSLTGGFWIECPAGDCNDTGQANLLDYGDLEACITGPGGGLIEDWCPCFDSDGDADVDLTDLARFQRSFMGG